jgi:hypothetical protein
MVSEIDLLKEDIPRLEKKFGADNPFVVVLKAQLASLQNQTKQQLRRKPYLRRRLTFKGSHIRKRDEAPNNQC